MMICHTVSMSVKCWMFIKRPTSWSFSYENILKNDTLVATVMSNLGMKKYSENNDIDLKQTKVGDRYVYSKTN